MSFLIKPYTIESLRVDLYSEIFCYLVEDFTAGYEFADTLAQKLLGTAVPLKFVVAARADGIEYVGTYAGKLLNIVETPAGTMRHMYYDGKMDRFMFDDERIPTVWGRGSIIVGVFVDPRTQAVFDAKRLQEHTIPNILTELQHAEQPYAYARVIVANPRNLGAIYVHWYMPGDTPTYFIYEDTMGHVELTDEAVLCFHRRCRVLYESADLIVAVQIVR